MAIPKNKDFSDYDNYLTDVNPTTAAQAQDYFKNQAELLKAIVESGCWQPETNYAFGDVVYSPSFPKNAEAVCMKAGKSSTAEPAWNGQSGVSERVIQMGAGIKLEKDDTFSLLDAINAVLSDTSFSENASRISKGFRACRGAKGAADKILEVCNS